MPSLAQAADRRLPWGDEPEVLSATTTSTAHTLVGNLNAKIATADAGRIWSWVADGADVYAVIGQPVVGTVTGAGTSPPTATVSGTPTCAGALRVDVNATDGTLAGSTFDWSVGGTTIATAVAPVSSVLTLANSGLSVTFGAGTFNADQYWTWTNSLTDVDASATTGAAVPFVFKNGVVEDYALPDASQISPKPACIAIEIKAASTTPLRFWPSSGK